MRSLSPTLPPAASIAIIGAGFAGLATAYYLWQRGARDLLILEQEPIPGFHSSGRNAAIARRLVEDSRVLRLANRSLTLMEELSTTSGSDILTRSGGLLLGTRQDLSPYVERARLEGNPQVSWLSPEEAIAQVPALEGASFEAALSIPEDGVVDIHALLMALAEPVKAQLFTRCTLQSIQAHPQGGFTLESSLGTTHVQTLVNAAGFGANHIASLAGLAPLPFAPVRRHLFVTAESPLVAKQSPWVWDVSQGFYFRPEGKGLLLCACDSTPWGPLDPFEPPLDPKAREHLADTFHRALPAFDALAPTRGWAGLRTLTPDHRFVLGFDPRLSGFFWVAGLGGHGMTSSCGVGELSADLILGRAPTWASDFSPSRFLETTA